MQVEQSAKSYERREYIEALEPTPAPARSPLGPEGIVRFMVWVVVLAVAGFLLWYFFRLVLYLTFGFIIAYLTRPIVNRLQGLGMARVPAILLTFLGIFGFATVLITSLLPFFATQISDITQKITLDNVVSWTQTIEAIVRDRFPLIEEGSMVAGVQEISSTLFEEQKFTQFVSSAFGVFTDIFYAVLVVPFVTFFFLRDSSKIRRGILQLVPNRYFEVTLSIIEKIETNIGRYLKALLLQCVYVGIVATIFLSFTDLNYALIVGLFTGIANSIPYFGPFMGLIAGSLVAIAQTGDFTLIPGILIAMGLTQAMDNILFQPLIFSRAARTHPMVIMFIVLMGAQAAGIVGMLIAIPLSTTIWVTFEQVLWSVRNYRILRVS